jgi:hypothetical protein
MGGESSRSDGSHGSRLARAPLIYQHVSRAADEAIAAALDVQLNARRDRIENSVGARVGPGESEATRS